jgi:ring-1,2-phenylacetyl-CoA epoxidase subunit PaaB
MVAWFHRMQERITSKIKTVAKIQFLDSLFLTITKTLPMKDWPLWEIFIRSKQGLSHKHVGSLHAADEKMAIENARDVYCRRNEGISIWVVESKHIHASTEDQEAFFDPSNDKVYRHPTFYKLPDEVKHM